jgi:hypothetical protein
LRRFVLITIVLLGCWGLSHSAQIENKSSIHYSADGDTAHIGNFEIEKSNGYEHPSPDGARLGTAQGGATTSITWGPEVRLTHSLDSSCISQYPVGAVWHDTIFVVFDIALDWSNWAPLIIKSSNGGENWSEPWCVTNTDTAQQANNYYINLYDGNLNMAGSADWTHTFEYSNVYTKRSTNYGQNWSNPQYFFTRIQHFIGSFGGTASKDTLLFGFYHGSGDYIEVDSIKVARSFNGGLNWSEATDAVFNQNNAYSFWLRYSMGKVHLVYQEFSWNSRNTEIFYSQSPDWGITWSTPIVVSDDSAAIGQWPYLYATDDGRLIVSWFDYKYGSGHGGFTGDILFRLSTDNGNSWGPEMRLTYNQEATASRSFIITDHIGIIWEDARTGLLTPELYCSESSDMGATWSDEVRLTNAPGASNFPELLVEGHNLFLFWLDARDDAPPPDNDEIYFRKAEVLTGIQQDEERPLPDNLAFSAYPNPFNSATTLTISSADKADISIYDITGRLVTTLHAENGKAIWNASSFPSGLYFARVNGKTIESIKLILLK